MSCAMSRSTSVAPSGVSIAIGPGPLRPAGFARGAYVPAMTAARAAHSATIKTIVERRGAAMTGPSGRLLPDQLQKSGEPDVAITQRWLAKPTLHCETLDSEPLDVKVYSVEGKPPTQSLPHHAPPPQKVVVLQ